MPVSEDYSKEIKEGKNARTIKCKFCNCIILKPSLGNYIQLEFELPTPTQNVKDTNTNTESVSSFWEVLDMFTFHNISFSNTVANNKYLACADCDAGPIGYHDLTTKKSYVALSRVDHI